MTATVTARGCANLICLRIGIVGSVVMFRIVLSRVSVAGID